MDVAGALYLGLTVMGAVSTVILIGWAILAVVDCMCLYDLFTLPRQVQKRNRGNRDRSCRRDQAAGRGPKG